MFALQPQFEEVASVAERQWHYVSKDTRHEDDIEEKKNKLVEAMECPVCLQLPRNIYKEGVYNCHLGHIICNDCLNGFKLRYGNRFDCPQCRSQWRPAKNLIATNYLKRRYRKRMVK